MRYLELQREAVDRGVSIRRVFVFDNEDLARDESFFRITQMQRDIGIDIRILDFRLIQDWARGMISDLVVFDGEVSYEVLAGTSFNNEYYRPTMVRTMLVPTSSRVKALNKRFEQLWAAADPERTI